MADYIKRSDVVNMVSQFFRESETLSGCPGARSLLTYAICAIPAADVRPVVKAKWAYTNISRLVCSNCGNPVAFVSHPDRRWDFGNYCPNCGADMRPEPPKEESTNG